MVLSPSLSPPPVLNRNLEATTIPSPHRNCRHNCASLPNRIRNPHLHLLTIICTLQIPPQTSQKQSSIAHPHLSLNDVPPALLVLLLRAPPPFFWVVLDLSLSRLNYWQSIHAQKGLACFILCHNAHPQKREKGPLPSCTHTLNPHLATWERTHSNLIPSSVRRLPSAASYKGLPSCRTSRPTAQNEWRKAVTHCQPVRSQLLPSTNTFTTLFVLTLTTPVQPPEVFHPFLFYRPPSCSSNHGCPRGSLARLDSAR